jgi:hypothetical protein
MAMGHAHDLWLGHNETSRLPLALRQQGLNLFNTLVAHNGNGAKFGLTVSTIGTSILVSTSLATSRCLVLEYNASLA